MSLDLLLEFVHHLAVFALVGVLSAEFAMLRSGIAGARLVQLATLDAVYGGLAGLIVVAGAARVIWGDAGWAFYVLNWVFWGKMVLFAGVGLLSIRPTLKILGWRRAGPEFTPPAPEIAGVRRWLLAEFALLAFIPIFAAMMARGIGL
jgi:putative membrane protein